MRLDKIVTGTYNVQGNYKIVFKTNLNGEYRTMYDNLSTMQNHVLDASPAALGLASNEYVTEFMVSFGIVPLAQPPRLDGQGVPPVEAGERGGGIVGDVREIIADLLAGHDLGVAGN